MKYYYPFKDILFKKGVALVVVIFLLPILSFQVSAQFGNIWYFGDEAGIDFNSGTPVALTNSSMNAFEGCASLADAGGNLMFYTDGVTVWNSNHDVMANGSGLLGNFSSTQSAIIMPKQDVFKQFYIFTVSESSGPNTSGKLHYSIVDLNANGGLGEVLLASKNTLMLDSVGEKLTSVAHSNDRDFWVLVTGDIKDLDSYSYKSFLISSAGVSVTPVSSPAPKEGISFQGYLKASPKGDKLACVNSFSAQPQSDVYLSDFNNSTGVVSNHLELNLDGPNSGVYGVEFSPNGLFLYVSDILVSQFDISSEIEATINNSQITYTSTVFSFKGMQLGPDSNIYVTQSGSSYLAVIEEPDSPGVAANLSVNAIDLKGKIARAGLPNIYSSFIIFNPSISFSDTCENDVTNFSAPAFGLDSVVWDFGDPASGASNNTSALLRASHVYSGPGTYLVTLNTWSSGILNTYTESVKITPMPYVDFVDSLAKCDTVPLMLDVTLESVDYLWQDGSTASIYNVTDTGDYWVTLSNHCGVASDTVYIFNYCEERCTISIANVITPNGDGTNDSLLIKSNCSDRIVSLSIFDRWGSLVHYSTGYTAFWDGYIAGEQASSGIYFYLVEFDERTFNGYFSLFQ